MKKVKPMKHQDAILRFLKDNPNMGSAEIQRAIGMKRGNIYQIMKQLVIRKLVIQVPNSRKYSLAEGATVKPAPQRAYTPPPLPDNPLVSIYTREIEFIEAGIDSLMVTKNYLERRIQQLELESKG